jgi:aspartyl protease family protein
MKAVRFESMLAHVALSMAMAWPAGLYAAKDIHVVALFRDRAMVEIDGKRHLLRSGETSPEGVTLVSADSDGAVFKHQGRTLRRSLDGRARAPVSAPRAGAGEEVRVYRDTDGMFTTTGSINGLPVGFLVDTGASSVAMNAGEARRLGIDFRVDGESTYVSTASGVARAYSVRLDRVKVGSIELRNVEAVVVDGSSPTEVLLGMSFLQRLELLNQGDHLTLRKKY